MAKYTKKQVIALFLDSINYPCKIKENDEYPGYMTYNFNILDVQKFHKEMLSAGFYAMQTLRILFVDIELMNLEILHKNTMSNLINVKKKN